MLNNPIMRVITALVLSVVFVFPIFAQTSKIRLGQISELKGKNKVYIATRDSFWYDIIKKAVKKDKNLRIVNDENQADFFLEYNVIDKSIPHGRFDTIAFSNEFYHETGEVTAYFYDQGNVKVIAWSKSRTYYPVSPAIAAYSNQAKLTEDFIRDFRK